MSEAFSNFLHSYILSYSGFAAMGILAVLIGAQLICTKYGVDWMKLLPVMLFSFIPLYIGAKLFGVLSLMLYRLQYDVPLFDSLLSNAGIVFYGGLLAYLSSNLVLTKRFLPDCRQYAMDVVGVTVPLFHGFARIGCYVAGCCYGVPCSSDVCMQYFSGKLPVQLIESGFNFILFAVLLLLLRQTPRLRGHMTGLYLLCYSVFRFVIEFYRADIVRGGIGPLSFSQIISACILIGLAIVHGKRMRKNKREKEHEETHRA